MEKAPGGSFFFAENGSNSFKEIAEMISGHLAFGGKTVSLPLEDVVRKYRRDSTRRFYSCRRTA